MVALSSPDLNRQLTKSTPELTSRIVGWRPAWEWRAV